MNDLPEPDLFGGPINPQVTVHVNNGLVPITFHDLMPDIKFEINDRGGWTIKETETHYVDVIQMIFNDRICLTPKKNPLVYDYGWCFDKGGAAIFAAFLWNSNEQAEPQGFKKRVGNEIRTIGEQ